MADQQQKLGIVVYVEDQATGKLTKVKAEVAGLGATGSKASAGVKAAASGVSGIEKAASRAGTALSHAKSQIGGLISGPLGMLGLAGAAFTVGGALEQGIGKANAWGLAIEKLQGLTSDSTTALSGYLALTDKFNISEETATQIVGFTEKALGKLENTTVKAAKAGKSQALQALETQKAQLQLHNQSTKNVDVLIREQKARDQLTAAKAGELATTNKLLVLQDHYGVQLADNKGQALSFTAVLLNVADAYSKAGTAAQKASVDTLAAQVFGRGYAQLVPILKLGRQGILDAEAAAAQLGLTLSDKNVADLAKFRQATREAGDAVSGLELQLGLIAAPDLASVFSSFASYMATHRGDVQALFHEGLQAAESFVGFLTGTVVPAVESIGGAAARIWGMIPAPMQDLLVKGLVARQAIKWTFGIDIAQPITSGISGAIKGALGGMFQRGGSPANPMFVSGVGGGVPGAAGSGGGLLGTVMKVAIVAVAADAAIQLWGQFQGQSSDVNQQGVDVVNSAGGASASGMSRQDIVNAINNIDQQKWGGWGLNAAALVLTDPFNNGLKHLDEAQQSLRDQLGYLVEAQRGLHQSGATVTGPAGVNGVHRSPDTMDVVAAIYGLAHPLDQLHRDFLEQMGILRKSQDPRALAAAAAKVAVDIAKGVGSLATTRDTLATLKRDRTIVAASGDKAELAKVDAAIRAVEAKVPGREWVQRQLAEAQRIARSSESQDRKTADLKAIQQSLLSHSDTVAAQQVARLGDVVTAVHGTTDAVLNLHGTVAGTAAASASNYGATGHRAGPTKGKSAPAPASGGYGSTYGHNAMGAVGMTRGATAIGDGVMGEAGTEAYAIIRNPRRLEPTAGSDVAPLAAAIGRLEAAIRTMQLQVFPTPVTARDQERASVRRSRIGSTGMALGRL